MSWTRRGFATSLGSAATIGLLPRLAAAHPYHTTLTQARHNRKQGTLECSLRADPDALQAALRRAGSPKLKIDRSETDDLDRLCDAYLRAHFRVQSPRAESLPLAFVGHELNSDFAWLHFQFAVGKSESLVGFRIQHQVFFEIAPAQVNRVQVRHGAGTQTLLFRVEHPIETISA
jgi:hypothetical protein